MKINDILLEANRQRHIATMYHGTSSVFLKSILKHGLLANPPKRVYSSGDDAYYESGQAAFPDAVYLAKKFSFAREAAQWAEIKFGGVPIIVIVEYVKNSAQMDEDSFVFDISNIMKNSSNEQKFISGILDKFKGMSYNEKMITGLLSKLHEFLINYMSEKNISFKKRNINGGDLLNHVRGEPEFDNIVYEILKRVNPKDANTIRIARNIGFSGKTKIVEIIDTESGKVFYPR